MNKETRLRTALSILGVVTIVAVLWAAMMSVGMFVIKEELVAIQAMDASAGGVGSTTWLDPQIDIQAVNGLNGVADSLAYRVEEIEHHLHSYESWMSAAASPSGEIHVADNITVTQASFQVDAGNDTWSTWLQILGSSDTPVQSAIETNTKFDLHRIAVVAVENANADHFVQLGCGASGAAALAAGTYTEFVFRPISVQADATIYEAQMRRQAATTKCWLRLLVDTKNTSTMDFYFGVHEYPGN